MVPCWAFRFKGCLSTTGSVLCLVTRKISHPFPGLSPLGFCPRYCCLPRSPNEVLGPGLLATNFNPTLTSLFAGSHNNLQSIVQKWRNANRGLTRCNAKPPMQETQWCWQTFTSCNALGTLALKSHNPALWNERSHGKEGSIGSRHSPKVTPIVAHVATLQSLAHRFTGMRIGRWNAGHNDVAPHWSPSFILGAVLFEVTSHQQLERPNAIVTPPSDAHTRCHEDLSSAGSLRCDQCALRNAHSVLCIAPARLHPQHCPGLDPSNPPSQAIRIVHPNGLELSSVLFRLQCTLLCAVIRTLKSKSANRYSRTAHMNNEGSTNCMPSPQL